MKSYTDLSQSKRLAEFLPLESADRFYMFESINGEPHYHPIIITEHMNRNFIISEHNSGGGVISWSLAALLDILYQVKEIKHQRVTILVGGFAGQQWYVEFVKVQDEKSVLLEHSKELVDACVEMIERLHELKML